MSKSSWSSLGAVGSALLASSCCLVPLALTLLGAGSFGLAASLERYRPIFMGITFLILGTAWYFTYRKRKVTCADGSCEAKGSSRWNRITLWLATGMAIAFMLFPQWSTLLVGADRIDPADEKIVTLAVSQMTCGGCALTIKAALESVPGVEDAAVDYETGTATVRFENDEPPVSELIEAVRKSGYDAQPATGTQSERESPQTQEQEG